MSPKFDPIGSMNLRGAYANGAALRERFKDLTVVSGQLRVLLLSQLYSCLETWASESWTSR